MHTSYHLVAAAQRVRKTAQPQAEDFAATSILNPPPEALMLEQFTRISF